MFQVRGGATRRFEVYRALAMVLLRDARTNWGTTLPRLAQLTPLLAGAMLAACTIDTRTLDSDDSHSNGSGGDSDSPTTAGGSGGQKAPDVDVPACNYATRDLPTDCESLAENPGFAKDATGWQEEPYSIQVGWDASDAHASGDSGSAVVSNTMPGSADGIAPGGAMQCLPATPGATYVMGADVFIPDGQGEGIQGTGPFTGQAGLSILFWRGKDCQDTMPTLGSVQTDLVADTEVWRHVEGSAVAPEGIGSLSIRMLTIKPFKQIRFQARFDNVLLQAR